MTLYALRDDSCVLHLPMNEDEGSVVYDHSRYGNNGQIVGANWTQGKFGKALSFDGVDDYVEVPDSAELRPGTGEFSVFLWVYPPATIINDYPEFIRKEDTTTAAHYHILGLLKDSWPTISLGKIQDANGNKAEVFYTIETEKWVFLGFTWKPPTLRVYYNGEEIESYTNTAIGEVAPDDPIYIGKQLNSLIDEVRIYNRALSEEEIKSLYLYYQNFEVRPCILCPRPTI